VYYLATAVSVAQQFLHGANILKLFFFGKIPIPTETLKIIAVIFLSDLQLSLFSHLISTETTNLHPLPR
jgi:hypothetical protein